MPNGDGAVLSAAQRFDQSVKGTPTSRFAPKTKAATTTPMTPHQDALSVGDALRGRANDAKAYAGVYPAMHEGGVVPEDGVYALQKGEKVVSAKENDMAEETGEKKSEKKETPKVKEGAKAKSLSVKDVLSKDKESKSKPAAASKSKKSKHRHTHIEHHDDGSHTIRHTPRDGGEEMSYSRPDSASMMEALQQNIGGGEQPPAAGGEAAAGVEPPVAAGGMPQEQ